MKIYTLHQLVLEEPNARNIIITAIKWSTHSIWLFKSKP